METKLNPYLSFKDNTRQAMDFYQTVFGGKLAMSTFKDYHASQDPSEDNKIMHADAGSRQRHCIYGFRHAGPDGVYSRDEL